MDIKQYAKPTPYHYHHLFLKLKRIENKLIPLLLHGIQVRLRDILLDTLDQFLLVVRVEGILSHVVLPCLNSRSKMVHEVSEVSTPSKSVGYKRTIDSPPESGTSSHCFVYHVS